MDSNFADEHHNRPVPMDLGSERPTCILVSEPEEQPRATAKRPYAETAAEEHQALPRKKIRREVLPNSLSLNGGDRSHSTSQQVRPTVVRPIANFAVGTSNPLSSLPTTCATTPISDDIVAEISLDVSAPPSVPSAYLAPSECQSDSSLSALTSLSSTTASIPSSELDANLHIWKRFPELFKTQAQCIQLMQELKAMAQSLTKEFESAVVTATSKNALSQSVVLFATEDDFTAEEKVDLIDWFSIPENKGTALEFTDLPPDVRNLWLRRRIDEINASKA